MAPDPEKPRSSIEPEKGAVVELRGTVVGTSAALSAKLDVLEGLLHQSSSASTKATEAVNDALRKVRTLSVTTSAVVVHFSELAGDTIKAEEAKARLASLVKASDEAMLGEDASTVDTTPRSSNSSSS